MSLRRNDLADFATFMAIARHRSFRRAAIELGVTPSALSHAMSALEERRGLRLLNRTTRSVSLTAAGEELFAALEEPLGDIADASERLNRLRDTPAGHIRINVLEDAVPLILAPVMPEFVNRYPDVLIDISVSNRLIDVIGSGFDAGIRYGGTVPEDMIAQRLSPDIRWVVAAAPSYLERVGRPAHPQDLARHRCIGIRLGNDQVYRWEFEHEGEEIAVAVPSAVTVDDSHAALAFGIAGMGVIYAPEPHLRTAVVAGRLELLLEDWSPLGEGFHLYYSSRRQVPTALKLLIGLVREINPLGPL